MGKLDHLIKDGASHAAESISRRQASPPIVATAAVDSGRHAGVTRSKDAAEIELDRIAPDPDQPRTEFPQEELDRLAESIRRRGVIQPITVRWVEGQGTYLLIAGERRWRAARIAGLAVVPCRIYTREPDPDELLMIQVEENAHRADLRPVERARAFKALIDRKGWSMTRLAAELSLTQGYISQAVALLELPATVQTAIDAGEITGAAGYEISRLPADEQEGIAKVVASKKLTVDATKAIVRERNKPSKGKGSAKSRPPRPRTFRLAGAKITIEPSRKATGPGVFLEAVRELASILEAEQRSAADAA
jgi:ParB family chromosome partitioning protein